MSPNNYIKKVAIVGATGNIGAHVTKALLQHPSNFDLTALTRTGSDSGTKLPAGIRNVPVDYADPSTLASALQGQDALIITLSVRAPEETQTRLVEAAAAAGVRWVLPNEWGQDEADEALSDDILLGPAKRAVLRRVEGLRVSAWVGVVTGFWYEVSLAIPEAYGMDMKGRRWIFFDEGETRINTVTMPQTGRAVANLLALPIDATSGPSLSQYRNKFVYATSFRLSQRDMFESVLRVTGTSESDWTITHELAAKRFADGQALMQAGDLQHGLETLMYARSFFKDGGGDFQTKRGLDHEALELGLVGDEDLDEYTKIAVEYVKAGLTYG